MRQSTKELIYKMVRRIPHGKVATYGQIANYIRLKYGARQVGYALSQLPEETDVPWHRVVNAQGRISPRSEVGVVSRQETLLQQEGIVLVQGRLSLKEYQWQPTTPSQEGKSAC